MNVQPNGTGKLGVALLSVAVILLCSVLAYAFIFSDYEPIDRDEAVSYSGAFEEYETAKNYCGIHFADGSVYEVYPHTETGEFRERMESLPKGTVLHLLINPHEEYAVEIRTDSEEILNFEASQEAIDSYDNGYVIIGIVVCSGMLLLIPIFIGYSKNHQAELERIIERAHQTVGGTVDSKILRRADMTVKCRILLEKRVEGYHICYRRVKSVNELVINGMVYDEKKGIVEFAHNLAAVVDGHLIEAGYDGQSDSYIRLDEQEVARKLRVL